MFTRLTLPQGGVCNSYVNNTSTCAILRKISLIKTAKFFLKKLHIVHIKRTRVVLVHWSISYFIENEPLSGSPSLGLFGWSVGQVSGADPGNFVFRSTTDTLSLSMAKNTDEPIVWSDVPRYKYDPDTFFGNTMTSITLLFSFITQYKVLFSDLLTLSLKTTVSNRYAIYNYFVNGVTA